MYIPSESRYASWAVRGLAGAVSILSDLAEAGHYIDQGNLLELAREVQSLVAIYNHHAQQSSLEPHERPTLTCQPVQPAGPTAADSAGPADSAAG